MSSSSIIGVVRLRQIAEAVRHRLSFIPIVYVLGSIVLVQLLLWIDSEIGDAAIPAWLETTVDSARSVFGAIAGGLITSITLLLSMMLVTVQLASSQFSPRTLRDWLGNRDMQNALGFVLGTTVFCLLALRSTRDFEQGSKAVVPHITVLVAVALGVLSLVAVVRTVDHITHSLQVGSVAERVARNTIEVIGRVFGRTGDGNIRIGPESGALRTSGSMNVPVGSTPLETPASGWVQQIDSASLIESLPENSTGYLTATVGDFVTAHSPVMWIAPSPADPERGRSALLAAIAVGESRTMQQDIEFGIIQLTDIAVRALSPGVNDPSTACEVIVHLGDVMTELWRYPPLETTRRAGSRTLVQAPPAHDNLLDRAFRPIVHYGRNDTQVTMALRRVIELMRSEAVRRELPGPIEPIDELLAELN